MLMNHLCDGTVTQIIETGWCVYPMWYTGAEFDSISAFNFIKDAIQKTTDLLKMEIDLAKRLQDTRRIGKFETSD